MDWLDQAYDEFSRYHRETQAARKGAESVYQNLWSRIVEVVHAANEKGMQLTTNGLPHSRVVAMPAGRGERRDLTITLKKEEHVISVESDAGALIFRIGVDDTQVVCLLLDGKILSGEEAAQKIMESFLFAGESPYAIPRSLAAQAQAAMRNWGKNLEEDPKLQVPY